MTKRAQETEGAKEPNDSKDTVIPERVTVLFERCVIACALYAEFWLE